MGDTWDVSHATIMEIRANYENNVLTGLFDIPDNALKVKFIPDNDVFLCHFPLFFPLLCPLKNKHY